MRYGVQPPPFGVSTAISAERGRHTVRGFEYLPHLLLEIGVSVAFGMVAETNAPWLASGEKNGLRFVRCRHEATAVLAAGGYARSTGSVGVATVTRGPGFANAVNALASIVDDSIPVVLIVAHSTATRPASQYLEQERIARLIGAEYRLIDHPSQARKALALAFSSARRGVPQVVALNDAVLDAEIDERATRVRLPHGAAPADPVRRPSDEHSTVFDSTLDLLARAERPLVVAGRGAVLSGAEGEILAVSERLGARVGTTLKALGAFGAHPLNIGLVGGWAAPAAYDYFHTVDCVVAFGASMTVHTTDQGRLFAQAPVIHCVEAESPRSYRSHEAVLTGDAAETARRLLSAIVSRDLPTRVPSGPSAEDCRRSVLDRDVPEQSDTGFDVREVAGILNDLLPSDRIVVTDSGRAIVPMAALFAARDAASWHHGRGFGSIGLGLGFAIGAAVAHPDRRVVLLVGDGAFLQSAMDLDAAVHAHLSNLLIVVLDDGMYGMEAGRLRRYNLDFDVITQPTPDVIALTQAFGAAAQTVTSLEELAALTVAPTTSPLVLWVRIDPLADMTVTVGNGAGIH